MQLETRWVNKSATRLPEAHMVGYGLADAQPAAGDGTWLVEKLGQYVDVRPSQMAAYCSTHLHAAGDGGVRDSASGLAIRSLDAALVSLGAAANPWPSPVVHAGAATAKLGAADGSRERNFMLQNNLWDTNYPVWFPFDELGGSLGFRFEIDLPTVPLQLEK